MQYDELLRNVLQRARALKLLNPETGDVDTADCERAVLKVVRGLTEHWDFDEYTVLDATLFTTQEGERSYPVPADYGRRLYPKRGTDEYGLAVSDGSHEHELVYRTPLDFRRYRRLVGTGRPAFFTEAARSFVLDPPPDTNGGAHYTGIGTYIKRIEFAELEGAIPFTHSAALEDMTIGQLAIDWTHADRVNLVGLGQHGRTSLVNDSRRARFQGKPHYTAAGRRA